MKTKNELIDTENWSVVTRGAGVGQRGEGVKRYKLPVINKAQGCEIQQGDWS